MRTRRSTLSMDIIFMISLHDVINFKLNHFERFVAALKPFFLRLRQPGDPVEVRQSRAEADERLPGGISSWPQGGDVTSD